MHETLKLKDLSFEMVCAIIAQVVQAANRQYNEAIGGMPVNPAWEQILETQRQGLIKAVRETVLNPKTPERQHEIWCEAKKAEGYTRDERIDHIRKTHPSLVPFNELSFEEQLKDALFLGITSIFASALDLGEPPEAARPDELEPAGEGDGDLIDEIDEYTESPDNITGTVEEAAEAAQEKLDNISYATFDDQGPEIDTGSAEGPDGIPIGGYDSDNPPPEEMQEPEGTKEPELPLPPTQESLDVDLINAHHTKLAVAPELPLPPGEMSGTPETLSAEEIIERQEALAELDKNNEAKFVPDVQEPTQAPDPKPNLPDKDVKPAKAKKAKKK